ncbi:ATP-binding cassette domain-containing protein [Pelosinus sp. sgz500959]|uniref:ATP-binding cassette domain-containing protein n=1 Tax=Pelosinus sp. sgz500959 TaxID=3242472 RepID=UPI00366F2F36
MLLQITNLMKTYKGNIAALHDINCSLKKGIVGVIGPNSAGKTTFLKIIAGLEEPTSGQVRFDGLELRQNKQIFRSMIGYLPQEFGFYSKSTGEAILDYIAVLKGIDDKKMRQYGVDEVIDLVNLNDVRKLTIKEYSFGMKRRLGIAQALLGKPRILILDEPMEGLDPGETIRLGRIIGEMASQSLVIISTHSLSNVEFGCSTLLVLRQGYMLYDGTPAELISLADGLVWQVEATFQQIEQLKATFNIVGIQQKDGYMVVRILSPQKPPGKAIAAKARLEEGYLTLLHSGVHS